MLPLLLREEARKDIDEAHGWYNDRRPGLGSEFLAIVRSTLESIESSPSRYPIALDDIRKAPLHRFPYVVYFVVLSARVSVIAVLHHRRHPRHWEERR